MYGVSELAKMYSTTRQTVYNKFKDERLQEYLTYEDGKKRLKPEGLQLFGHVMADCKTSDVKINNDVDVNFTSENRSIIDSLTKEYIESLKQQIEDLKKDKSILQEQLTQVMNTLIERQRLLDEPQRSKSLWRIFGK